MYTVVQSSRLSEQIVQQIEDSVLKGDLKAGEQLPAERDLAGQFGVSRTAVREALKTLREKGLVEAYAGRGTFVTTDDASRSMRNSLGRIIRTGSSEGAVQLVEVREILEPGIAALAAQRADEDGRTAMREAIMVMDAAPDAEGFIEGDLDFHLALAEAAGNPLILTLIDSIVVLLREQRMRTYYIEGGPERGQYHHKRILEAIERSDPQGARDAMCAHLRQVREDSEKT
jgi:GntR family transcriptional regulator, transcriptional repressor for pyruvate dehydrogenase complex